jgi:hypothetical protein
MWEDPILRLSAPGLSLSALRYSLSAFGEDPSRPALARRQAMQLQLTSEQHFVTRLADEQHENFVRFPVSAFRIPLLSESPPMEIASDVEGHAAQRSPPTRDIQRQTATSTRGPPPKTAFAFMADLSRRFNPPAGVCADTASMTTNMTFLL